MVCTSSSYVFSMINFYFISYFSLPHHLS
uniref:Uncharacterized protein n=1 Tax=Arundo donax TaxID=35708 RepID=A0A0A9EBH6_ARUDO